ncbi:MAG: gamma-glutamyltransferase family protein [Steroidobacteraceae bacterium]
MMSSTRSSGGMVTAPHALAAESGARILAEGGNAIEAALATAATLTVVYPHMTGLGGDSFWLIAEPGRIPLTIDGAGRAGSGVSVSFYRDRGLSEIPWRGALAANTVAGAVSAWAAAWEINRQWGGRLPLARVFAEAIAFAKRGTVVTDGHADAATRFRAALEPVPGFSSLHFSGGAPPVAGTVLGQPALARTFSMLARDGLASFYSGSLARQIAAELASADVPLCAADLADQRATLGRPLLLALPVADLFNCGPPSQGLASLLILGIFSRLPAAQADTFAHVHGIVESTKLAFAIRDREIGHPEDDGSALEHYLTSPELDRAAACIDPGRAAPWQCGAGDGDTAWFGVIDGAGRAVSAIQSLYFEFGSGVGLPESGFVWQNRGCAFRLTGEGPNVLAPRHKPFHTLNPAFARFPDGRTMVYGAMGGDGQPQTQAALFTRFALYGQDLQDAISAPRWLLGRTWGESRTALRLESRFPAELLAELAAAGHPVERVAPFDQIMGHAGAIVHSSARGFQGASDPRSDGAAIGYSAHY